MALEIGQKVKVSRLRDRVSADVVNRLGKSGVVNDFRLVDGSDVGVVVKFDEDQFSTWFFEDELKPVQ